MKRVLLFVICLLFAEGASAAPSRGVGDFALLDHTGTFHQLSRYDDSVAIVLYVYGDNCSVAETALPKLNLLQDKYKDRGVKVLMLNPIPGDSRESVLACLAGKRSAIPVLMDSSQLVSQSLGAHATGEVFVIDPMRMKLLYRGAIDSRSGDEKEMTSGVLGRNYLDEVLSAVLTGAKVIADVPWSNGLDISYSKIDAVSDKVSYVNDVVPILKERCVSCHKEGGVAPWAMDSYQMVSGWSAMMRETLMTMRMPPGQIDERYLHNFVDVHFIADAEKAVIVNWANAGAPKDGDSDPLTELPKETSNWALGEPDLIVEFPIQEIPPTGVVEYKFVPVEIGLDRDRWVRGYEFDVGNTAALHHVVVYTQDEKQQKQNPSGGGSRTNFGGYAPGREYIEFDDDTGVLLEKGMRFMVQFHYTTIGRSVADTTRIGLYFQDAPPAHPLSRTAVMNGDFVIPPGASDYEVIAKAVIATDSNLYNIAPHMHYRGKRVKYRADYPDGTIEELLSIPNFQHNWQMLYRLKEPKFLPAGTVIVAEGAFDNSERNALNPDPTLEVRWGDQVWDEMFIAWMGMSEVE